MVKHPNISKFNPGLRPDTSLYTNIVSSGKRDVAGNCPKFQSMNINKISEHRFSLEQLRVLDVEPAPGLAVPQRLVGPRAQDEERLLG